jgi:outer membrane immunogenic protein
MKHWLAGLALGVGSFAPALAADIPVKAPPPAPVAIYKWTVCYVGAGVGYGLYDQKQFFNAPAPSAEYWDNGGSGWLGTVQVGCDYQVSPSVVIGAFGDYDWNGLKGNVTNPFLGGVFAEEKLKSSWAAGGRIGWVPWQKTQLLLFVSGGYTEARFSQVDYLFTGQVQPVGLSLVKRTYSGWFLGAGYEYGLSWLPGLFWKTEYRFADYGPENLPVIFTAAGNPRGDSVDAHKYIQTVRTELVWRFNAGDSQVAYAAETRRTMPVKTPEPVVAYSWSGCYVGAGGGYGMFNQRQTFLNGGVNAQGSWNDGGRGWFGTAQIGCDYQARPDIVVGAFADYDWSGIKGHITNPHIGFVYADEKMKSSWAAGGRIGWLPFRQQFLLYAAAGYTEAKFDQADYQSVGVGPRGISLAKHTYNGWFLGAGYEYGLGWVPGLFWKTEYRFADYGTENVLTISNGVPNGDSIDSRKYIQSVRSELVWRFNFGGPVVARY